MSEEGANDVGSGCILEEELLKAGLIAFLVSTTIQSLEREVRRWESYHVVLDLLVVDNTVV